MADFWEDELERASLGGVAIPIRTLRREGGRRKARHVYPYRDGQHVEDLGREPLSIELEIPLYRGMAPVTPGVPLYPDVFSVLRNVFDSIDERGEVEWVDPELGPIQVAVIRHAWQVDAERRNGGVFRVNIEEVSTDAYVYSERSIESPRSSAERHAARFDEDVDVDGEELLTAMDAAGVGDPTLPPDAIFGTIVDRYEQAVDQAAITADEVAARVDAIRGQAQAIADYDPIKEASRWSIRQSLIRLGDAVSSSGEDAVRGAPQLVDFVVPWTMSAIEIAAQLYGDRSRADEIVQRNPTRNPLFYPKGQVLRVLSV